MKLLSLVVLLTGLGAWSAEIVFLEIQDKGKPLIFEEGFPYTHVAMEYRGKWIHAYPGRGVECITRTQLEKIGRVAESFHVPDHWVKYPFLEQSVGKPYDHQYSWTDDAFYCSELIGKALGMGPLPMHFDLKYWPKFVARWEGLPGISPSLIYRFITAANRDLCG